MSEGDKIYREKERKGVGNLGKKVVRVLYRAVREGLSEERSTPHCASRGVLPFVPMTLPGCSSFLTARSNLKIPVFFHMLGYEPFLPLNSTQPLTHPDAFLTQSGSPTPTISTSVFLCYLSLSPASSPPQLLKLRPPLGLFLVLRNLPPSQDAFSVTGRKPVWLSFRFPSYLNDSF